jgi:transcription termination factor Rho
MVPPQSDSDDLPTAGESTKSARRKPARTPRAKPATATRGKKKKSSGGDSPALAPVPEAASARIERPAPAPEPAHEPVRQEQRHEPRQEEVRESPQESRQQSEAPANEVPRSPVPDERAEPQQDWNDQDRREGDQRPAGQQGGQQGGQQQGGRPQGGFGGGHHGGGGGQFGGHGGWGKRGKKKKGKWGHGGPGGQGGPGGGGGGGGWQPRPPSGPQQPPPPEFVSVTGILPDANRFNDVAALDAAAAELGSSGGEPLFIDQLAPRSQQELVKIAGEMGITFDGIPSKHEATVKILATAAAAKRPIIDRGLLDLTDRGYGFIVHPHDNYRLYPDDTYLPASLVKRYGLKRGHHIEVRVQPGADNERCPSGIQVISAMGRSPDQIAKVKPFEDLVPYYPLRRILLEVPERDIGSKEVSMRLVDIVTPVGFGQRALIVAPPRTGKTVLLHNMANSISTNYPEIRLIILLVDERPEEVTDFKRHTKGEVVSSTFDETPESHVHAAEMVGEMARRLVEDGQDVVVLLDSITRLARAYNALASNSGKIMSGGMEATAMQKPKRFFGAARNIEEGGSLTVIGTALVDTGSKMDEVIFEEFKGTGNLELHLDRDLVNKRIFPAVNVDKSGTRKEELIYHPDEMKHIYSLRRAMQGVPAAEAMDLLIQRLRKTKTNAEFLMGMNK